MNTAFARAQLPAYIYAQWNENGKGSEKEFFEALNKCSFDLSKEDVPHKSKSLATMLVHMHIEHKFDFSKWVMKFEGDEFSREDTSWFYRETVEFLEKVPEASGVMDFVKGAAEKLMAQAKNFK